MQTPRDGKIAPSSRWTSYDGWDYNGMKERLEEFMSHVDKDAFIIHANKLLDKNFSISEPFSAGQYWACFELIADDGTLVIARGRLPRHPDTPTTITIEDELYAMACESAVMEFLRLRMPSIPCPRLYAYAAPGSELAASAGCAYMLIEGFYGNTLQDVQFDICKLSISQQERIMSQWTAIQAELATVTFPQIGSICHVSEKGEPTLGKLSTAPIEGLPHPGPFPDTVSYFGAVAQGRLRNVREGSDHGGDSPDTASESRWTELGILVFIDIVRNTEIYSPGSFGSSFHFSHMDLGTQNILVDDSFNFLAIIDWEFAQSAPWEVNHYPMPFPLVSSSVELEFILNDSGHIAYQNVRRQAMSRKLYREGFLDIERRLRLGGRELDKSMAETLDSPAAKIYNYFEKLGVFVGQAKDLTCEMTRLAFGHAGPAQEEYLERISSMLEKNP